MIEADRASFAAALTELASLKPGAKLTAEQYTAWWNALRETWELEDFRAACRRLAREVEFMPNPFHFEQVRKSVARLTAGEAWARVREVAQRGGSTSGDSRIDAAARVLGGYRAIGYTNTDQMHFLERRFAEHYDDISDAEDAREELPGLGVEVDERLYNSPRRLS